MKVPTIRTLTCLILCSAALPLSAAEYEARLALSNRIEIGSLTSGVVTAVTAQSGAQVAKGATLVRFDDRLARARIGQAQASLERNRRELEEGERQLERAQEMYDRTMLSDHDLELAKLVHARAAAQFHEAKSVSVEARREQQYNHIKAPFDALVVAVHVAPGQTVHSATESVPLVTLAAARMMEAQMALPLESINGVALGGEATVVTAGKSYQGTVSSIGLEPLAGSGPGRYRVAVTFGPFEGESRAGGSVKVVLP